MRTIIAKPSFFFDVFVYILSILILIDFGLPGHRSKDLILEVQRKRQEHYNPSGNFHYSYKIVATKCSFSIGRSIAKKKLVDETMEYSVSPIFKEVNWFRLINWRDRSYYSLRIISGLILPLLSTLAIYLISLQQQKFEVLKFVIVVFLSSNFFYILL